MKAKPIACLTLLLTFAIRIIITNDLVAQDHPAQEDSIHFHRTGNEISILERNYFGLFPKVSDFSSANISPNPSDTIATIRIKRSEGADSVLTINWTQTKALASYFQNFEKFLTRFQESGKVFE